MIRRSSGLLDQKVSKSAKIVVGWSSKEAQAILSRETGYRSVWHARSIGHVVRKVECVGGQAKTQLFVVLSRRGSGSL